MATTNNNELRKLLEKHQVNVGWDDKTRQVTADGQNIDTSGMTNVGGRMMANDDQMNAIYKQLGIGAGVASAGSTAVSDRNPGQIRPTPNASITGNFTPGERNPLASGDELARLYGLNIDRENIQGIFDDRTEAQFATLNQEFANTENRFSDRLFESKNMLMDANRKANAEAVATGASKGVQAATQMLASQGLAQTATEDSTMLAQERNLLAEKESEAYMKNAFEAFQHSQEMKKVLSNLSMNNYATDTQAYVGDRDADARIDYNDAIREGDILRDGATDRTLSSNERVAAISANATVQSAIESAARSAGVSQDDFFNQYLEHSKNVNDPMSENYLRMILKDKMSPRELDTYINELKGVSSDDAGGAPGAPGPLETTPPEERTIGTYLEQAWHDLKGLGAALWRLPGDAATQKAFQDEFLKTQRLEKDIAKGNLKPDTITGVAPTISTKETWTDAESKAALKARGFTDAQIEIVLKTK